jgi:undecaprenyl-diphosphatase
LILGTIPAVVAALLFKRQIDEFFEPDSPLIGMVLGLAFLFTSALLAGSQVLSHKPGAFRGQRNMNWLDALVIGVLQAVGITPGVSRSGATLSGALFRRLDRDFAARFSFLLSIPAILGALVLQLKDLLETRGDVALGVETTGGGIGPGALIAGTLTAAVVGFFAVRFMLKLVKERSLWGFVVYTGVLGILVLADRFVTHFYF